MNPPMLRWLGVVGCLPPRVWPTSLVEGRNGCPRVDKPFLFGKAPPPLGWLGAFMSEPFPRWKGLRPRTSEVEWVGSSNTSRRVRSARPRHFGRSRSGCRAGSGTAFLFTLGTDATCGGAGQGSKSGASARCREPGQDRAVWPAHKVHISWVFACPDFSHGLRGRERRPLGHDPQIAIADLKHARLLVGACSTVAGGGGPDNLMLVREPKFTGRDVAATVGHARTTTRDQETRP